MSLSKNQKTLLFIVIAFIFSFSVRLIWVYQFQGEEQFKFNNEFMINTNDGYYWAEGARDILAGHHQENDLSPIDGALSILTAFLAKILPIQFETLIFYMPAFFASLIVIPIVLIAREINQLEAGFIAALLGSIAWSYYNRTMVGYYDTDMLNIVLPMFLLWSVIWAIGTRQNIYLIITALDIIIYRWWYPQSIALEFAFVGIVVLYACYQFLKLRKDILNIELKNSLIYTVKLVVIMLIAMMMVDIYIRAIVVVILFFLFLNNKFDKYIYYILILSIAAFLFTGGINYISNLLNSYVFRSSVSPVVSNSVVSTEMKSLSLQFFSVMQTVKEAGQIPFETFANRISGHTVTLVLSCIGYILLSYRYKIMLFALPMLGLGFLAYGIPGLISGGGLRFTIYAVPIMALGIGYLIVEVSIYLANQLKNSKVVFLAKYFLMLFFTGMILYPNIKHIEEYKVPTVFTNQEVQALDKLKIIAKPEDYVVAWWDYGYPLRYYSNVKTLIDGAKHGGAENFPISYMFLSPQELSAKMARLDVEYTEKTIDIDKKIQASSNIEEMTLNYGYVNTNEFLQNLNTNINLPQKTRDIYFYFPHRMMNILPTIEMFHNIDLMNGKQKQRSFFYISKSISLQNNIISLGNKINILQDIGKIQIGKEIVDINSFIVTSYDNNGRLNRQLSIGNPKSFFHVIYMKDYNRFLVLDNKIFNSMYIQLFVLENFNQDLYEATLFTPLSKIYKLKL